MKIGFDNDKYLAMQSEHIRQRIAQFDNKLYLEFGGKLFDDYHASRVLPGFQPDSKLQMLLQLKDQAEIVVVISAEDIVSNKMRGDYGITYDMDVLRLIDAFQGVGLYVGSVCVTMYTPEPEVEAFENRLNGLGIRTFRHYKIAGYPNDVARIVSEEGYGKNQYIETQRPLVVVTAPGPGSGKMAVCLSQLFHEHKRGVKAGYAKFETFPIWNLPLKHPVNLAYEAATADLNDVIVNGEFGDLVRINEALHEKKIACIADMIYHRKDCVKLVLIAGPSSSGKTSFANRLGVQLRVLGIRPHVISMDDYFINRDDTPVDEFGKRDYENINCIDIKQFNEDINALIEGKAVELPSYNFVTGMREYKGNVIRLKENEIMIIEGIHGLNDELTPSIKPENKFKIFISAMTQLNLDNHKFISTSDSRLLRRMVRDNLSRGNDAAATISAWPYVTRGEEKNIFPFQENADVMFNSATIYELAVLKQYAEPLLYKIDESMPEYLTAKRLIKFLAYFLGAPAEPIPNNSLIREFVGGSVFHV